MQLEPVDLAQITRHLIAQLETVASAKEISLPIQAEEPMAMIGDHDWLETAILNLLDNAIRYTPEGGHVTASVAKVGSGLELGWR
jgi:signal transduction histidine kinase